MRDTIYTCNEYNTESIYRILLIMWGCSRLHQEARLLYASP
nr:MAG TPA: hypothetical protein [Caudoviricetes sp.]